MFLNKCNKHLKKNMKGLYSKNKIIKSSQKK